MVEKNQKKAKHMLRKVTEKVVAYWAMILASRSSQFDLKSVNEGAKPQASLICDAVRAHLSENEEAEDQPRGRGSSWGRDNKAARPLQG